MVSPGLRNLLLRRSIFDILCDLWFIPLITLYVKALIKPLLFDMTPAQAKKMIETELPHKKMSDALLTKGIVNLFSEKTQAFLLNNLAVDEKIVSSSTSTDENDIVIASGEEAGSGETHTSVAPKVLHEKQGKLLIDSLRNTKVEVISSSNPAEVGKTHSLVPECGLKQLDTSDGDTLQVSSARFDDREIPEDDLFWDNFWVFKQKQEEEEKKDYSDAPVLKMAKRIATKKLALTSGITGRLSKIGVSGRKAFIMFLFFAVLFGAQLKLSRRFRMQSLRLLQWMMFATTATGFGAAFLVLLTKLAKSRKGKIQENKK